MSKLSNDEKNLIKAETDTWIRFKKKERMAKQNFQSIKAIPTPTQNTIPKLLSRPFLDKIKRKL